MDTETTRQWALGDRLPNGATVVTTLTAANPDWVFVLAEYHDEFVTWALDPASGTTFNGHYYRDASLAKAVHHLYERAGRPLP